jgi:hypothetical protein
VARIQTSATTFEEVRRTVTVLNSTLSLGPTVSGTPAFTNVDVRAISDVAITEVSATLDRVPAGSLNAPNACSATCKGVNDIYRFTFETASMGVGEHTVVITAVDVARSRRQVSVTVPFTNTPSPVLTLASPLDGALVYDTLQIAGTAFSDRAGTVTVTARLGDVEFYRGTTANFSASYKVAGLLPGPYTLLIRATDAARRSSSLSRTVLVTSASERAYAPLFTMPLAGQLRAVEGTQILYDTGEGRVVLRDAITGTEVTLDGAAGIEYSSDWQLSGGRVYVSGKGADCVQYCIYQWTADGTRVNLTNPNPYSQGATTSAGGIFDLHPVARSGYVAWVNDMVLDRPGPGRATGRYTIHNVATGTYTRVGVPADANYVGNWRYDLAVVNGVVHFYFWGQTGGSSARSMYDIYKWQSDTGATTRLTPGGAVAIYVQTDGVRVAWQQSPSTLDETHSLMVQPVEGGAAAVAGSHESTYLLEDGVLAWAEKTPAGLAVRASTATSAVTRLGGDAAHLVANAGGHVIYVEQGKIYSWNAATGVHTLRLEGPGGPFMVGGGALVFVINQTVYRVAL